MKKNFLVLASLALFTPSAWAAQFASSGFNDFEKARINDFSTLSIRADQTDEITASNDIHIFLDPELEILWHHEPVSFSGTAVTNGRVGASTEVIFSEDYKILTIPVSTDFLPGEELKVEGLKARTYYQAFGKQYLGVDLNNDGITDLNDENHYRVENNGDNDLVAPYPIHKITHEFSAEPKVTLKWSNPPDYDLDRILIDKYLTIDGKEQLIPQVHKQLTTGFVDTNADLKEAEKVRYVIRAVDFSNNEGEPAEVTIDLKTGMEVEVDQPEDTEEEAPDDEEAPSAFQPAESAAMILARLNQLLPYYHLRYLVHCESAAAVAGSDACLLSKMNLVYAQTFGDRDFKLGLALNENDLERLTALFSTKLNQYKNECQNATELPPYCAWLDMELTYMDYFL